MCDTHFHVQSVCNSPQFESEDLEIRRNSISGFDLHRSLGLPQEEGGARAYFPTSG